MKHLRLLFILIIISVMLITSCAPSDGGTQIAPDPDGSQVTTNAQYVVLYFGDQTGQYIVKEQRELKVSVNRTLEECVIEELIKGPSSSVGGKLNLINPSCKLTNVTVNDDVITVTFDRRFLDWSFLGSRTDSEMERLKYLAVYSVVDTLVEATGHSKVQIMIDKENSGVGSRLMGDQVGFVQESGEILGQLQWDGSIALGPENTMSIFLDSLRVGNYESAYSIFAYNDSSGAEKPSSSYFSSLLEDKMQLESYSVKGVSINYKNDYCWVIVDFSVKFGSVRRSKFSIPIKLVHENDIWKLEYSEFLDAFGDYIQE